MYRKNANSWLKHWDFILLDLIVLQIAYIFSCMIRNGWAHNVNKLRIVPTTSL